MDNAKSSLVKTQEILEHMFLQGRLPSVMVLEGPKNIRQDILSSFIPLVFCQKNQRCGQCEPCLLLKANTHPDIHIVQPQEVGHAIKIEQIRELIIECQHPPLIANHQLVLIEQADTLNINAANALLKILEEPSLTTHFILLLDNHQMLIPTIRSRAWLLSGLERESIPDVKNKLSELQPLIMSFLQNKSSIVELLSYFEGQHLDQILLLLQCLSHQILIKKTLVPADADLYELALIVAAPHEAWWLFYDLSIQYRRQNMLQASLQTNLVLSRLFLILKGFY